MGISIGTAALAPRRAGSETSDADLVAAVRVGDERAFEWLYERYHRRIASYIYGMVHDYARAEDIAQDVFMSALRRIRETERAIAFKPWIYEIAKNACIDQFRRSRRAEEVSFDADDGLGAADYGRLVSGGPGPDAAVATKQDLDHLRGAFGGLSETHHEILVMRELEGLSYREIGDRLGMSRPSVESTLFRARRRLTEEYDELVTGERCVRVQAIIATAAEGALGARDMRRMARHLTHCQPCRRHARVAGLDPAEIAPRPVRAKIAALLPLPLFLKRRWGGEGVDGAGGSGVLGWSNALGTIDPGVLGGWGRAAAAAATVAVAGVGAGVAGDSPGFGFTAPLPGASFVQELDGDGERSVAPVASARPTAGKANKGTATARRSAAGSQTATPSASSGTPTATQSETTSGGTTGTAPAPSSDPIDSVRRQLESSTGGGSGSGGDTSSATGPIEVPDELPTLQAPASAPTLPAEAPEVGKAVEGTLDGAKSGAGSLLGD